MKFRTVTRILFVGVCIAVLGAASIRWSNRWREVPPRITTSSVCDIAFVRAAFAGPPAATLRRLRLRDTASRTQALRSYDQGPAVMVAPTTLQQIRDLLERRVLHNKYEFKPCDPEYQLLLTLPSSPHDVQLALCFRCGIVGVYEAGFQIDQDDFEAIAPELALLIKPLFPEDSIIQSLN